MRSARAPRSSGRAGGTDWLTPSQAALLEPKRFELFANLDGGQLQVAGRDVDLGGRRALLAVLRAVASVPGAAVSPGMIAQQAWAQAFHPLRHHTRLTVAITRLRHAVRNLPLESVPTGYRLVLPASWAFLDRGARAVAPIR